MENIETQIAALRHQLNEYSKAWANDDIPSSEYWKADQAIRKQISKLREQQPGNFNSPEPTPGHFSDPFLQLRFRMLKDYNAQLSELRVAGIKDHVGHRVYGAETLVRAILTRALTQTDKARSLEVLERIRTETERKLDQAKPLTAAA